MRLLKIAQYITSPCKCLKKLKKLHTPISTCIVSPLTFKKTSPRVGDTYIYRKLHMYVEPSSPSSHKILLSNPIKKRIQRLTYRNMNYIIFSLFKTPNGNLSWTMQTNRYDARLLFLGKYFTPSLTSSRAMGSSPLPSIPWATTLLTRIDKKYSQKAEFMVSYVRTI